MIAARTFSRFQIHDKLKTALNDGPLFTGIFTEDTFKSSFVKVDNIVPSIFPRINELNLLVKMKGINGDLLFICIFGINLRQ